MKKIKIDDFIKTRNIPITNFILNDENFEEYETIERFVKKDNNITEDQ